MGNCFNLIYNRLALDLNVVQRTDFPKDCRSIIVLNWYFVIQHTRSYKQVNPDFHVTDC